MARAIGVDHGSTEKYLVDAVVHAGVCDLGNLQPLGQKTDAPVDFAQPLLAVDVVAVLRAVAVAGGPMHGLHHLGPLGVYQVHQLRAQTPITARGDVVFAACRHRGQLDVVLVLVGVRFPGKSLAHGECPVYPRRRRMRRMNRPLYGQARSLRGAAITGSGCTFVALLDPKALA